MIVKTLSASTTIEAMPMPMQSAEFGPATIQPTPAPISPSEMMNASIVLMRSPAQRDTGREAFQQTRLGIAPVKVRYRLGHIVSFP